MAITRLVIIGGAALGALLVGMMDLFAAKRPRSSILWLSAGGMFLVAFLLVWSTDALLVVPTLLLLLAALVSQVRRREGQRSAGHLAA